MEKSNLVWMHGSCLAAGSFQFAPAAWSVAIWFGQRLFCLRHTGTLSLGDHQLDGTIRLWRKIREILDTWKNYRKQHKNPDKFDCINM